METLKTKVPPSDISKGFFNNKNTCRCMIKTYVLEKIVNGKTKK